MADKNSNACDKNLGIADICAGITVPGEVPGVIKDVNALVDAVCSETTCEESGTKLVAVVASSVEDVGWLSKLKLKLDWRYCVWD